MIAGARDTAAAPAGWLAELRQELVEETYRPQPVRPVEPGGRLFLLCFSDEEPGTNGPRRVSRQELYDAFADGWEIESIQPARVAVNPEFAATFSEGGPKAWFAVVRRTR